LGRRAARGVLAALVGIAALPALWRGREASAQLGALAQWIDGFGAWAPLAFVGAYALAAVAFVPGLLLTLSSGALFGSVAGSAYAFAAASLGACAAFLIARHLARGWVERWLVSHPRLVAIDRAVASSGVKVVLLLRLSPVFQYNLLNYALGLAQVRFRDYLCACVGMLPATIAYAYLGSVLRDLSRLDAVKAFAAPGDPWLSSLLSVSGAVATLAASAVITRIARRALARIEDG
jgi:uncharacterized membrane protein YdjX (TVP38/TMEM64 family)